jgi:hypothetical protein
MSHETQQSAETVMGYVREAKLFENHAGKDFL